MRLAVTIGMLALAGCAASAEMQASQQARAHRDLGDALKGRTAGVAQDCVSTTALDGPQIIDSKTVLYSGGGTIYRNDLASECPSLTPLDTIVIELHGSQMCRNDMFRVVEPGTSIPGPYCRLGKFTPYRK